MIYSKPNRYKILIYDTSYDYRNNPILRELGATKNPVWKKDLEAVKDELINEGSLRLDGKIRLTQKGKHQLKEKMKRKKCIF